MILTDPMHREEEARWLGAVREIVLRELAGAPVQVYLFGSRARGTARRTSDVDVAVEGPVPAGVLSRLREALEDSNVPVRVDVIELRDADDAFRARVLREAVPWTS